MIKNNRIFIKEDAEPKPIDWEQRRYEIAKECLPYWLGWIEKNYDDLFSEDEDVDTDFEASGFAIGTADTLIKLLKGEKDD